MLTDHKFVTLRGGYLKEKEELNRRVTQGAVYDRFLESGRIDAFRCDWKEGMPHRPHFFWDSDVAKWMEGAAYLLGREEDPALLARVEALIDCIEKNQDPDGYFNIYFTVVEPGKRFTNRDCHELYCAGHLIEAAVAYYEETGRDRFLRLMEKYARYLYRVFVTERSASFMTPGHEEIELALYRLYKATGERLYFDLMAFFLNNRGLPGNHEAQIFNDPRYAQSHLPVREQKEAIGHTVRAMYLYSGMADLAAETGDEALLSSCRALFEDVTRRKMYVTGGIGSTPIGEAFTVPYDLPDATAYAETCASIGMIFFASRLFRVDPLRPSRYADIIELELYNGALSGLSLGGDRFFYENPLEIYLRDRTRLTSTHEKERFPITQRPKLFGCSCCPPNLVRLLASLGDYLYAYDEEKEAVYVQQFAESEFVCGDVRVVQKTRYPADGRIALSSNRPLLVRIPGWCREFTAERPYTLENGYARFGAGEVTLTLSIVPVLVGASMGVVQNIGKAALCRGPVVYCAEGVDNPGDLHTLYFDRGALSQAELSFDRMAAPSDADGERSAGGNKDSGASGGLSEEGGAFVPTVTLPGWRRVDPSKELYAPLEEAFEKTVLRLIPYHAFANRGETDMLVYLHYR